MKLDDIVAAIPCKVLSTKVTEFSGVGTDTRVGLESQLFIALCGPNYDAHNFLKEALQAKATGLLVHDQKKAEPFKNEATVILVKDTLQALQGLGNYWRRRQRAKILAVTGSNGKTTTKEFAAALIGAHKKIYFNKGSFNNHWGVPLSLLNIRDPDEVAIIEMGMNHRGEISRLCQIAEPDVALVTNVGRAHLEGLGSLENVAQAKEEIYQSTAKDLLRIFNLDNPFTYQMWLKYKEFAHLTFSNTNEGANIFLQAQKEDSSGFWVEGVIKGLKGSARVNVFGPHNIYNLMAAAALALSVGIDAKKIWDSFPLCQTPWGRNQKVKLKCGAELIFDGYNANPESMAMMLASSQLVKVQGRRIAVLGEMRETGSYSYQLHQELGEKAAQKNFDLIWFVGLPQAAFAEGLKKNHFRGELLMSEKFDPQIAEQIKNSLCAQDYIWVKGSRGVQLEQVVEAFEPIDFTKK